MRFREQQHPNVKHLTFCPYFWLYIYGMLQIQNQSKERGTIQAYVTNNLQKQDKSSDIEQQPPYGNRK